MEPAGVVTTLRQDSHDSAPGWSQLPGLFGQEFPDSPLLVSGGYTGVLFNLAEGALRDANLFRSDKHAHPLLLPELYKLLSEGASWRQGSSRLRGRTVPYALISSLNDVRWFNG